MKKTLLFLFFCSLLSSISAQELLKISSITIKGNSKTKESIIHRELSFAAGSKISPEDLALQINTSKANLTNLKLFNFIDITSKNNNNTVDITINLVERWYIWPYPIFEISDRNFNSWWKEFQASNYSDFSHLNYGVFFNWENFRGRNELLKIKIRRGFKEHYLFSYKMPYLNKSKTLGISTDLQLFRRKSTFYNTINNKLEYYKNDNNYTSKDYAAITQLSYRKGLHQTHTLKFSYFNSIIDKNITTLNPNYLGNNKDKAYYFRLGYQTIYEKRDNSTYPLQGHFLSFSINKYFKGSTSTDHLSASFKAEKHFNLRPKLYLGSSFKAKTSTEGKQPYHTQKALGFDDYIRGYEYYVVDGQQYWLSKSALKYAIIEKTNFNIPYLKMKQFNKSYYSLYISIFSDLGYVKNNELQPSNTLNNSLLWSKGIGLDYVTYYDKLLRIEYSINHLGEKGVFLHFSNPF